MTQIVFGIDLREFEVYLQSDTAGKSPTANDLDLYLKTARLERMAGL